MKKINYFLILFVIISKLAVAQQESLIDKASIHICTPSKGQLLNSPLYIVKTKNSFMFNRIDSSRLNKINPSWIKSIDIYKGSTVQKMYGLNAKYGLVEITLKDGISPDSFYQIKNGNKP